MLPSDLRKSGNSTKGARTVGPNRILIVAGLAAATFAPIRTEAAGEHLHGKWTTPNPAKWNEFSGANLASGGATHMVLLRGSGDSTWILHWL